VAPGLQRARVFRAQRRAALTGLAALLLATTAGARPIEYLYVEPNTASGGHVALRVGDRVHHYQHAGGALHASQVHADWFRYLYSVLQNRTIHVARVDVDDDTWEALDTHFGARATIEQQHFAVQRSLTNDRLLLEQALAHEHGSALVPHVTTLRLRGAGYFFAAGEPDRGGHEPRIAGLRERIGAERGAGWLDARMATVARELEELDPADFPVSALQPSATHLPRRGAHLSDRLVELTLQRLALEVLARSVRLRPETRVTLPGPDFALEAAERAALTGYALRLERESVALLDSHRPDWGYPLLVSLARLAVVDASLEAGRWIVLDTFPPDAIVIPAETVATRSAFLAELEAFTRQELAAERAFLGSGEPVSERRYQGVEDAANRTIEVARGRREGRDIRVHGERLIPHGELAGGIVWRPRLEDAQLAPALAEARRREQAHARALSRLYRYDLFTRNCVTEIFAAIDDAIPADEQTARLGGRVEIRAGLGFWPRFSFGAVERSWRVREIGEVPSYRRTRLAQMSVHEHPLRVHLREASTLTSSVYRRNPRDSFFLFFTRDAWLPRPVYGLANLLAGVGQTAVGLARLPFDRGEALLAGAKGVAFSFPELAFISLRKGTLEYARSSEPRTAFQPR
jgi:hypothetical protein